MRENTMLFLRPGRRAFLGMLATAVVATVIGCGGGGGGGGSTPSTVVTGTVFDSAKQDLEVEGATVTIGGVSGKTTTTAEANSGNTVGSFRLTNVTVGANTAVINLPDGTTQTVGFVPSVSAGTNAALELFVNIGQITGRVLLPNGTPAEGAFVSIAATGDLVQTDKDGKFLVINIPKGDTSVSAVLGTSSVAKTVTVDNGLTNIGDMTLVDDPNPNPPGTPNTIIGTVKTTDNSAADAGAGASVILLRDGVQLEQTTTDAATGSFGFYVPVGNYSVRVIKSNYLDGAGSGTVSNPNTPLRIDVTLTPR